VISCKVPYNDMQTSNVGIISYTHIRIDKIWHENKIRILKITKRGRGKHIPDKRQNQQDPWTWHGNFE